MAMIWGKPTLILLLFFIAISNAAKDLPSYFPRCRRSDPKLNECLLNATETVRPFLIRGVRELAIPPIEPFLIPQITLEQGTSAVNFKATISNLTADGLSNYKFSKFIFDVPNLLFICRLKITPLHLNGIYSAIGKVLLAPIQGKGVFTCNVTDITIDVYQKVKTVKRKSGEYILPTNTTTTIDIKDASAHLDGLFNGNEALAKATNDVINDNIHELIEEVKPAIQKVITSIVEDLLFKSIENAVPFNRLYPKD